jgi:two-component system cell cycle response regulator
MKNDPSTRSTPVLLYAEMATAEERIRAFDLGVGDFICKPYVGAELLARVRRALRTRQLLNILEQRAHLDGLTGLANRGVLEVRLPGEWEECRRRGRPLSVIIADLDHFKSINDTHGHAAGDEVLRQVAGCLAQTVRTSDLLARYGGEEFVVIAPDCELEPALRLAERFRKAIAELKIVEHGVVSPVSMSVGVAGGSDDCDNAWEMLRRADDSLYRAKQSGRNATWFWNKDRQGSAPAVEILRE